MCSYHCCDPRDEVLERKFYCIVGSRVIKVFSKLIFHGSSIERERATVHTPSADTTFTPFQSHHASSHAALHHRMRHCAYCDGTRLFARYPTRSDAPVFTCHCTHLRWHRPSTPFHTYTIGCATAPTAMAPAFSHAALHDLVCPSSHVTAPTADGRDEMPWLSPPSAASFALASSQGGYT